MSIEYKQLSFEVKADSVTSDGEFEGYASMFGVVDLGDDVVVRGAFTKSLNSGRKVKLLWQHDTHSPIGAWVSIAEDERGLFVKGKLLGEVQKGREIDSMSIGFRTIHSEFTDDGVRKLTEVELHEISLVTFPMLPDAKVTDVKAIKTEREFEQFLRGAGYSRKQAAAIASHGYKALSAQRDADADDQREAEAKDAEAAAAHSELMASLTRLRSKIHA